ncbi:MAG: UDP-N-acetylenolpyruvoylglucosamine reductase [Parcubacteria group bacterium CG2_30_36_18]|nr:MAG: UDP-N-acetylenolpyruvoylglucosamine reductase [Parcubacteria group bacterium CG2_30_36_18]
MGIQKLLPGLKKNVSLKNYTTFKIGGPAKYFFEAKKKEDLIGAVITAKKFKLPFFILGGGSNILVSDEGYNGLVIKCQMSNVKCQNQNSKLKTIYAESGVRLSNLVQFSLEKSLAGLEWAVGIPGMVGGAILGNAGAFGRSMKDVIQKVEVFDTKTGKVKIFKKKDCQFDYRNSIFKHANSATLGLRPRGMRMRPCEYPNLIILSATLQLKKGNKLKIEKRIKEYLNYRKETQPLNFPSAGSVFKNPKNFSAGELGEEDKSSSLSFAAARLIEECGLKGKRIGNVKISEKHANFIVNLGGGKAKDVKKLINLAKKKVKEKFGITLEEEICYLGFKN